MSDECEPARAGAGAVQGRFLHVGATELRGGSGRHQHVQLVRAQSKRSDAGVDPEKPGAPNEGVDVVLTCIYPRLKDPAMLRRYREEPWAVPPRA